MRIQKGVEYGLKADPEPKHFWTRIRIRKAIENGSNTNPDPKHFF